MSIPLRSRYSTLLLASRRAGRLQPVRFVSRAQSTARAGQDDSPAGTTTPPQPLIKPVVKTYSLPKTPAPEPVEDDRPAIVYSKTNPDPSAYRKVPQSEPVFQPEEDRGYDKSKPFYSQKLSSDDRIMWTALFAFLAFLPGAYWYYGYRKEWVKEKKAKRLQEYLERHPEHRHLAEAASKGQA